MWVHRGIAEEDLLMRYGQVPKRVGDRLAGLVSESIRESE